MTMMSMMHSIANTTAMAMAKIDSNSAVNIHE